MVGLGWSEVDEVNAVSQGDFDEVFADGELRLPCLLVLNELTIVLITNTR